MASTRGAAQPMEYQRMPQQESYAWGDPVMSPRAQEAQQEEDSATSATPGTMPLGKIFGVHIRAHYSLPLVFIVLPLLFMVQGGCTTPRLGVCLVFALVLYGPILFGTVLVHELSHALAAKCMPHGGCSQVVLWPLGGVALIHGSGRTAAANAYIAVLGPASHIPQLALWFALVQLPRLDPSYSAPDAGIFMLTNDLEKYFWHDLCVYAQILQVTLMLFNLLIPCVPLDGSQLFASLLIMCGATANATAIALTVMSCIMLGLVVALSILTGNFFLLVVAIFLGANVLQLERIRSSGALPYHPLFQPAYKRREVATGEQLQQREVAAQPLRNLNNA